jgi:histidinol-phosphate/aromatic aminotransferase/cobyric acid decarboxylase-like protein
VPGLRLGYLYTANERLVQAIEEELPIWHVSSLAEFFLEQCLKFRDAYEQSLRQTIIDRKSLAEGLLTLDAVSAVYGGGGNFILVELQGERCFAHRVAAWLAAEENILVKDVSNRFLDRKPRLRVALRDSASNERFLSAIGGALGALQSEMASSWV